MKDQGEGFEMANLKDPRVGENLLKDDGRGVLIMKSLMDEVLVKSANSGTTVQLVKYINGDS